MMKKTAILLAAFALSGCVQQEDLNSLEKRLLTKVEEEISSRLEHSDRLASFESNPIQIELSNLNIDTLEKEITGVLKTEDPRLKNMHIGIETEYKMYAGEEFLGESHLYAEMKDGVGLMDDSYYIKGLNKLKLSAGPLRIELINPTWYELRKATIVIKD